MLPFVSREEIEKIKAEVGEIIQFCQASSISPQNLLNLKIRNKPQHLKQIYREAYEYLKIK